MINQRIRDLEASNGILRRAAYEANEQADRAFWRGAVFGGMVIGLLTFAGAAWSLDISGSTITLEPSADPDAFADVVFVNDMSNGPDDTGVYTLSQDGLLIGTGFVWDSGPRGEDRITVTPPLGFTCKPVSCAVTVIEGQTGRITLMPYNGS